VSEVRYRCIATASFGLESLVRAELEGLGIHGARAEDRRVIFDGSGIEVARANTCLRTADRVLLELAEFPASDFEQLYQGVRSIRWRDLLSPDAAVTVSARSAQSRLTATPSIQSVAKKAVVDAMGKMSETGAPVDVEIVLRDDRASVCLDTTGPGLHKRGYRLEAGEAPLRENIAAALVLLSRWDPSRPFADPLCGAGTIAIEAALLGAGIAPGLGRSFAAESWSIFPRGTWETAREMARLDRKKGVGLPIRASDRDGKVLRAARRNAARAGVEGMIHFEEAPLERFVPHGDYGCLVCNPPYGERQGESREVESLYRAMGALFRGLPTWSLFALTAREDFPRFFGNRESRNRKLYNGNLRCWCYQYFGPLPARGDFMPGAVPADPASP
jgi:putative N6-adenine-specific DNA methylase